MSGRGKTERKLNLGPLSFTSKAPKQLTQKQLSKAIASNAFLSRVAKTNPLQAEIFATQQAVRKENINAAVKRFENAGANELAKSMRKGPNSEAIQRMFGQATSEDQSTASPYTFMYGPKSNSSPESNNNPPKTGGKRFRKTRRYRKTRRS